MKIISSVLILITTFLSLKHGWDALHMDANAEQAKLAASMGFSKMGITIVSLVGVAAGIAVLFPQTFFIANAINAATILLIMIFSLRIGNVKMALIEIPFLIMPLVLIYLGHPFKKSI